MKKKELLFSKHFVNDSIKLLSGNKRLIKNLIEVCVDGYMYETNSQYYRHSLKGNLAGISDFQVTGDIRLFVLFSENNIKFLRVGSHSHLGI